ncbi:hypothetical protein [Kitasatospora griseola]|uniref:hypothetical protein n=1 Tax=Kitasatospora griseola TaxID=2064 RepID=UPI0034308916
MNERLHSVLDHRGIGPKALAEACEVNPKTVGRCLKGRVQAQQRIDVLVFSGTFFAQSNPLC